MSLALRLAAIVALLLASTASATAQSAIPTLSLSAPPTKEVDTANMSVVIGYNLTGGRYAPGAIVMTMPPGALYVTSSFDTDIFTHTESPAGTHRWTTANPFDAQAASTTGAITVTVDLPTWTTLAGTPFAFEARLLGTYTPTGGSALTLDIATPPATTTATANPTFGLFWPSGIASLGQAWVTHPTLGVTGLQLTYDLYPYIDGWQPLAGGWGYTMTLGSGLYFMRAFSNNADIITPPGSGALTITNAPPELTTTPGGTITAVAPNAPLGRSANDHYNLAHAPHLYVQVFIPCSVIGLTEAERNSPAYNVSMEAHGSFLVHGGLGAEQSPQKPLTPAPGNAGGSDCGTGGSLRKYWDQEVGEERWDEYVMGIYPPKGILPIEAIVVDPQTPGFTDLDPISYSGDFSVYYCVLAPGAFFDLPTFRSSYLGTSCTPTRPTPITSTTHVVWYAPSWGGSGVINGQVDLKLRRFLPAGFVVPPATSRIDTNVAYLTGEADLDPGTPGLETLGDADPATSYASTPADDWQHRAIHTVVNRAVPVAERLDDLVRVASPGDYRFVRFRYYIENDHSPVLNPVITINVPDGVLIEKADGTSPFTTTVSSATSCQPTPVAGHTTTPDAEAGALVWTFGDDLAPYYMRAGCLETLHWVRFDPSYPWVNGEQVVFTATISGDNTVPQVRDTDHEGFVLQVPGGSTALTTPACQQVADASAVYAGFDVTSRNIGGMDLTNVATTFRVPRAGADGGTADATFIEVLALGALPSGASFEVSLDDGLTWSPASGPDPQVTHVRMVGASLPAHGVPVVYTVRLATSAASGETLVGRAFMSSTEVPGGDSGPSDPFVVGSCHRLWVTKFLDADRDGVQAGEPTLAGWELVVRRDGELVIAGVTDPDGLWTYVLPSGSYEVTELMPAASGPIWSPTTPAGDPSTTQSVTLEQGDEALAFGNACDCPDSDGDLCTFAACVVAVPDRGNPTADSASCGADTQPTCADEDSCSTDICDPATGACSYATPACDAVDYFIPVADATGEVVGNVRCLLADGAAPDCIMEAGKVKVFPLGAEGANTCGMAPAAP